MADFIYDPSLALYLPLYELDGASFVDRSAYGHLCSVTGALWTPQGRTFDGSDDKITAPDSAVLDIVSALTVEVWALHDADAWEMMVAKRTGGNDDAYQFNTENVAQGTGKPSFSIWVGSVEKKVGASTAMTNATWYHLVGAYNKTDLRIYRNGVLDSTPVAETGDIDVTTDALYVGWGYSDFYAWAGKIGEVRIYNRALTSLEIQHNYLATKWRYR